MSVRALVKEGLVALARCWTFVVACGLLTSTACRDTTGAPPSSVADPASAALADFSRRVDEYIALHKRVAGPHGAIDETKNPVEITGHEVAIGQAIRDARMDAKPGAIFSPEAATVLKRIIAENYRRSPAVRETTKDAEAELPDFTPVVNQPYPPTHPLATFPATLLKVLPPLPELLEYRFVTHHLILRDTAGNLIVDVLPNAVP